MKETGLDAWFDGIDREGAVCVIDVDGVGEFAYEADRVMGTGSAFKVAIALEVCCQVVSGELELSQWIRIDAEKAPLGWGTGLEHTTVCRDVPAALATTLATLQPLAEAAGCRDWFAVKDADPAVGYHIRTGHESVPAESLGPTTTARELATLYALIWTDRAGPAEACAMVRGTTHELRNRIAAGFRTTKGATFAGKGGTFPGIVANGAEVLTFADGHRYAIAILTRARHAYAAEADIDQHLAAVAAAVVQQLRPSQ